jgi:CHAT domain-containing protein
LKRDEAKKDIILKELPNYQLIHISCHGEFNSDIPGLSGLKMNDGTITAYDFLGLKLNAKMVVLSACESGAVKTTRGDEIEGLIRAIQVAGVRYVIASLWLADDKITREIFRDFYTSDGNVTQRMRNALLKHVKLPFYFWSLFQVYGC